MKSVVSILVLVASLVFGGPLRAANAPANDFVADAFLLVGTDVATNGSISGATLEIGEPNHGAIEASRTVWWRWTAPQTGQVQLTLTQNFGGALSVFQSNLSAGLSRIGSVEGGRATSLLFQSSGGAEYYFATGLAGPNVDPAEGGFTLSLSILPRPANDDFATPLALVGDSIYVAASNIAATREPGEWGPASEQSKRSLWWSWTAPRTGVVELRALADEFNVVLALYDGDRAGFDEVPMLIATNGPATFAAIAGHEYRIMTDGLLGGAGDFRLLLRTAPANDGFENRTLLTGGSQTIEGTNDLATIGPEDPVTLQESARASLWWLWTAPTNGLVKLVIEHTAFPFTFGAFSGSDWTNLTALAALSDSGVKQTQFVVTAGQPYVFGLASRSMLQQFTTGHFRFRIEFTPAPENDAFAAAFEWGPNTRLAEWNLTVATREPGEPGSGDPEQDAMTGTLWWRWTAPTTGRFVLRMWYAGGPYDVGIYTGDSLETLVPIGTKTKTETEREITWDATEGTGYRFAAVVPDYNGGAFLALLPSGTPTNDAFADRILLSGTNVLASGNSAGATLEPGESGSGGSVWWSWTAPANGRLKIAVTNMNYPLLCEIFEGESLPALQLLATAEVAQGEHDYYRAATPVDAGRTYAIRVRDQDQRESQGAVFDLQLAFDFSPPGDEFGSPLELTGASVIQTHSFSGAYDQPWETYWTGIANGQSLWFRWTAPESGSYCVTAIAGTYQPRVVVLEGDSTDSLASPLRVGRMDAGTAFWAEGGHSYRFLVHAGRPWWETGPEPIVVAPFEFALYRSRITIPAPVHGGVVAFDSTVNLTPEIAGPVNEPVEYQISIYPNNWMAKSPYPGHYNWRVSEFGTNGFAVRAMIDGRMHQSASVWVYARPHNDAFAFAEDFTGRSSYVQGTIKEASLESGESPAAGDTLGASVWYQWQAPSTGPVYLLIDTLNVSVSVFTGDSLDSLNLIPTTTTGMSAITNVFQAEAGTLYRIRVSATSSENASFYLRIPRPPPPLTYSRVPELQPRLEFHLAGIHDTMMVIQASTNLVNWEVLGYNNSGEQKTWTDPQAATLPLRFYRAVPVEDAFR